MCPLLTLGSVLGAAAFGGGLGSCQSHTHSNREAHSPSPEPSPPAHSHSCQPAAFETRSLAASLSRVEASRFCGTVSPAALVVPFTLLVSQKGVESWRPPTPFSLTPGLAHPTVATGTRCNVSPEQMTTVSLNQAQLDTLWPGWWWC